MNCIYCGVYIENNGHNPEDYGLHKMNFSKLCTCEKCDILVTHTNRILKRIIETNGRCGSIIELESKVNEIKELYSNDELRIIVAGTRTFNDYILLKAKMDNIIKELKQNYNRPIRIVSGKAKGADTLGERYARENGYALSEFPAKWDLYGKGHAGYVRNVDMAVFASEKNNIPILVVFWDGVSKGTKMMLDIALRFGIQTYIINY